MIGTNPDCPPGVSLFADHLDAALAAGEDLLSASLAARADLDEVDPQGAPEALDAFVHRLYQLESSLVLRLLQARKLSVEIARADPEMKSIAALFRAQTDALHDLITGAENGAESLLARAGDSHAYIRSRGLIAPEAAAPSPFETLVVDENLRVGGVVPLGPILDFVATTLDFLDVRFGLFMPDLPDDAGDVADEMSSVNTAKREAGPASIDSLAAVLGMVRASSKDGDSQVDDTPAKGASAGVEPEAAQDMKATSLPDAIESAKVVPPIEERFREPGKKDEPTPSTPGGFRSLSSLIAEVQAQPEGL